MSYYFLYLPQFNEHIEHLINRRSPINICMNSVETVKSNHESRCCTTLNVQQREALAHISANL